jgi:hypothetical protein
MKYIEYKSIEKSNITNIALAIIICSIIAIFFGWLYSLMGIIPIVYFNILITIGFGFGLAFTLQIVSKFLKVKDKKTRLIIIIIITIIGYYSHWISFIIQTYSEGFPSFTNYINYWLFPKDFFSVINEINKYGTWGIGFSGVLINGFYLTIIWIIEALVIFFIAIRHTFSFPENPFSEKLNKWYPKIVLKEEFESIYSSKKFMIDIKKEGINLILNLTTGNATKYTRIAVFYLDGEDIQYLSIENVYIEVRNNAKKNITQIIKPIEITTIEAKKILSKFDTEKEFYFDF